jgi:hypothetical protein
MRTIERVSDKVEATSDFVAGAKATPEDGIGVVRAYPCDMSVWGFTVLHLGGAPVSSLIHDVSTLAT